MNELWFHSKDYWNTFYATSDWGQPRQEILEIVKNLQRIFGMKSIRVLDLGCGPGRYSIPFAELGAIVDCVDFSEEALKQLVKQAEYKGLTDSINVHHCKVMEYKIEEVFYHLILASGLFEFLTVSELADLLSDIQAGTLVGGMNAFIYLLKHTEAVIVPGVHPHQPETAESFYQSSPKWEIKSAQADLKDDYHPLEEGGIPKKHKHYIGRFVAKRLY